MVMLPLLLLLAALLAFFGLDFALGRVLFSTHDIFASDLWHFHVPLKAEYAERLASWELPLWSHRLGTGVPLLAEGQVGALYPPNLLLFGLLPLPLALNLSVLTSCAVAAGGMWVLARDAGARRAGATLAALAFALSGFFICHARHLNMAGAAAWAPWLLWAARRLVRDPGPKPAAAAALCSAMSIFAGHPPVAYANFLVAGSYAAVYGLWRRKGVAAFLGWGACAALLGAALAAPQLLPTLELNAHGPRSGGLSYEEATQWDLHPAYLQTFLDPDAFGSPGVLVRDTGQGRLVGFRGVEGHPHFHWEVVAYVGLLPLVLALLAVALARRAALPWVTLGAVAAWLALGGHGGLATLLREILPGLDHFRFFSRYLLYAALALCLLAGLGLDTALERLPERMRRFSPGLAALACVLAWADLRAGLGDLNPTVEASRWLRPPQTVATLRSTVPEPEAPFRLWSLDPDHFAFRNAYHRAGGWRDPAPYDVAMGSLEPNLQALYGLDGFAYYFTLFPYRAKRAVELAMRPRPDAAGFGVRPKMARLFNVAAVLSPLPWIADDLPVRAELPGDRVQPLRGPPRSPYVMRIHGVPDVLPRAFLAGTATEVRHGPEEPRGRPAKALHEVARRLARPAFDPRAEVLVDLPAPAPTLEHTAEGLAGGAVHIARYEPERVELRVRAERPAWLVLSDTPYPGWEATVDGRTAPILSANVACRAVRVPAGESRVVMRYRPGSFRRGAASCGLGLLALVLMLMRRRRGGARERR